MTADFLDRRLAPLLDEPLPDFDSAESPPKSFIRRFLYWYLAIQQQQKIPVFGEYSIHGESPAGNGSSLHFNVAAPYFEEKCSHLVLRWLERIVCALPRSTSAADIAVADRIALADLTNSLRPYSVVGVNNYHFLNAAFQAGVPFQSGAIPNLFIYGQGCRSRWLQSSYTDETSTIGAQLARNKSATVKTLKNLGLPTPDQFSIESLEQALNKAQAIGYPVVVKPLDKDGGAGVFANLNHPESLASAYQLASKVSKRLLLEKHYPGDDYRLNVFRGQVVKILRRQPGGITGDGIHSIAELLIRQQQTPRFLKYRRVNGRQLMELDDEARGMLKETGMTPESVPGDGDFIVLRRKSNISAGGIQSLVHVNQAHPDNLDLAISAARALNLDLAGVDILIADITKPWQESEAVILEVNGMPQIGIEFAPEVYTTILTQLVPGEGRIPVHLVICPDPANLLPASRGLEYMHQKQCNGLSMPEGIWINGKKFTAGSGNGFESAQALLRNRETESALCVMTVAELLNNGLPADIISSISIAGGKSVSSAGQDRLRAALNLIRRHVPQRQSFATEPAGVSSTPGRNETGDETRVEAGSVDTKASPANV